jgi:serine/threonine-protein kinase
MRVGQRVGPFEIDRELGSGAMGSVYRALHAQTGKHVAIKIIAPGLGANETALARFEREAAVLKQLHHPNIVRLYATGRFQGTPFYAMEYIEGESLDRAMQRRGRLTWEEVVELGKQICAALQHAHEQGIVHRDLKPSNLMVLPDGTLKLTDFGIAKDLDVTGITSANCTVGTAAYMSPEQCRGERNLTHKSDLYSLGVVCYELLTGQKPFQAETTMDMFLQHVQGTFERPSRRVLDIPVWLDTLVCQLLEKKPESRPFDAAMVAQSLGQIAEKVAAQQSAGIDAARTRRIDRTGTHVKPDETDKQAARTLLDGLNRHRVRTKRRGRPFYEKAWFQAVGISALLAAIGGVLYLAFKPASAEQLFQQAQRLMESEETWVQAKDGPLEEFRNRYPNHPKARQVREWLEQIEVQQFDRHVRAKYRLARNLGRDFDPENDAERMAYYAVRYEEFGDLALARERWFALAQKYARADDQRTAVALAAKKVQELNSLVPLEPPEKAVATRQVLLEKKLTEAVNLKLQNQAREARLIGQDIIDLYHDDPVLTEQVQQARKLLSTDVKPEKLSPKAKP